MALMEFKHHIAMASVAASALIWAQSGVAMAQETTSAEAGSTNRSSSGLDEIIVTARKVSENLQDVPVSVTAFNAEDIKQQSANNISDLSGSTPGLTIRTHPITSTVAIFTMRGLAQPAQIASLDPSVGVYVDGLYWARSYGVNADLLDVSSFQSLKGPQGTLFGRNTTGGAILVETNRPELNQLSGEASATYGRFDYKSGRLILNVPLAEDVAAMRIAYQRVDSDGYTKNALYPGKTGGERDGESLRVKLRVDPTDDLSIILSGELFKAKGRSEPFRLRYVRPDSFSNLQAGFQLLGASDCYADISACDLAGASAIRDFVENDTSGNRLATNIVSSGEVKTQTYSGTLTYDMPLGTLKILGGYRSVKGDSYSDYDGSPFSLAHTRAFQNLEQWSVEGQITGRTLENKLNYAFGVFYFEESGLDASLFSAVSDLSPALLYYSGVIDNKSIGVYAQSNYELTDRLTFTGGIRWSRDVKGVTSNNGNAYGTLQNPDFNDYECLVSAGCPSFRQGKFSGISFTAGLDYKIADNNLIYAKISRGFRSGGVNLRETTALPGMPTEPFKPEKATSYEAGLKSEFFDRRVRFNLAGFYTVLKDLQRTFVVSSGAVNTTVEANAGQADFWGGEAELKARLVDTTQDSLTVGLSAAYVRPKYVDFKDLQTGFDRSREHFDTVPNWDLSVSATWEHDFGNSKMSLHSDYSWDSGYYMDPFNYYTNANGDHIDASTGEVVDLDVAKDILQAVKKKSGGELSARIAYIFGDDKYELAFFGRNILNNRQFLSGGIVSALSYSAQRRAPATYGVTGTVKF